MEEIKMKIFDIDGKKYKFSNSKFLEHFNYYRKHKYKNKIIKSEILEQSLAENLCVEKATVHSWKFGPSGPCDLDIIKKLSELLQLDNYLYLLKEDKTIMKLTNAQLDSAKKIYDAFVEFLHEFDITGGFTNSMWNNFEDMGSKDPEKDIYNYVDKLIEKINLVIRKEYFYLHDLPIYNDFIEFLNEDLYNTFEGKLSYAYRFEAISEGHPTTQEDYLKAMDKLNSIIEKYN